MNQKGLTLSDIHKAFGATRALDGVSLDVEEGEIVAVLGPSGCGKSTLLSITAGLETPDAGEVEWNAIRINDVPPYRRGFGLMFQDFALFPHMDVYQNVAFGLRMEKLPEPEMRQRVHEMLRLTGLEGFEKRDVNTLSGGEQQRIALARSLAPAPRLLMLDEPLGSLDRNLRERLIADLKEILTRLHQTALYVTHDQGEAFTIASRVAVMNRGKIMQAGAPEDIYRKPASVFVARFLGLNNLLSGEVVKRNGHKEVVTSLGAFPIQEDVEGNVTVLLRPETMRIGDAGPYKLEGRLLEHIFLGSINRATLDIAQTLLVFDFSSGTELPEKGEKILLSFDPAEAVQIIPAG